MANVMSSLIVSLVDRVTAPAKGVAQSIKGIGQAAVAASSGGLAKVAEANAASLQRMRAYMLEAVATAYVLKEALSADFIYALQQAAAGRRYLSPPLSEKALDAYANQTAETTLDLYETLTAREREILYLAAQGMTSAEIAERLMIGVRTVDTHRASMMRKLGLHTPLDLIRYAMRRGIVSIDS